MTTNREWLYSLDVADLSDWFDAQHVDDNGTFSAENDVSAGAVDANDANAAQDSRENGWYLRYDGYMTSNCNYLRIGGFKASRALDNHQNLVFVKFMGGEETDCRVYRPKLDACENLHDGTSNPLDCESVAPIQGETAENDAVKSRIQHFEDSREKLEADAIRLAQNIWHKGMNYANGAREIQLTAWQERDVIDLLDRQAAITEREVGGTLLRQDERIAELTAQVDELSQQLINERADCTQYRELFSKALTHAHEIANLQP